ncbi:MAG: Adaptive-response sensory-kinase SasA [Firmicutes bacterium ADurb.Bin419]|nr:MAG: Adaptive-response sensory-kinase SasA [Firmicutes bacterium ADurb.Bin419]
MRVRLFNVLVLASAIFCVAIGIINLVAGLEIISVIIDFAAAGFCYALLLYSSKRGRTHLCHLIFISVSFFILFPYLFFKMGGYYGGIPAFLVFAVVFTVFMLEGKTALFFTTLEIVLYAGLYIFAFTHPEYVKEFPSEKNYLISNLMDLVIVCIALAATMSAQVRLYRAQQKKLDEQNTILAQANSMKTNFIANASHEMRTPLTVTSVNVQTVMEILEDMGETVTDPEAMKLLQSAQSEIMRLSRMVGGMLKLSSMSESIDKQKLDFTSLMQNGTEMLHLNLNKRGNTAKIDIEPGLCVFGNADLLVQVLTNILQNAGAHTQNGMVTISAKRQGSIIAVEVRDTGEGISPELLPHVFERGVSMGGTGVGLYLCKTVVESHGGKIWIESEPGRGTSVYYTLPVYEGQLGGAKE